LYTFKKIDVNNYKEDQTNRKPPADTQSTVGFKGRAKLADYIFLLRPMILIPVWTFFLLGSYHAMNSSGIDLPPQDIIPGLVSFTLLLGGIYIVNQISDKETDLANKKLFLIPKEIISTRAAWIETAILTVASFAISVLYLNIQFTVILIISSALGAAYSLRPFRFKGRVALDVLSNAIGNGVLNTLAGWVVVSTTTGEIIKLAPYPFAVAAVHLATTLADIEGDRENGIKTTGTALGEKKGIIFSMLLMATAVVISAAVNNRIAFFASIVSLPVFLVPSRGGSPELIRSKALIPVKWATIIFSIAAGMTFRGYLLWIALVALLTRLYYKKRFSIKYPSL